VDISNWFVFPIDVFIDTQVYISEAYNFGAKGNLGYFSKQVLAGNATHITSDIVVGEVEKHIAKDVSEAISALNKAVDNRSFAIFRDNKKYQLQKIDESEMVADAISIFHSYLSDTKAFRLDTGTIDLSSVISDYFEARSPFGSKKDKKSEFPDAFNISMLRKYAEYNAPVIVVTGDRDFAEAENVFCFKTLGELLDAINSQNELTRNAKEYIKNHTQHIFDEVELTLMDGGYALEVDGTDTDQKGTQHGVEYDEIELLSFSAISLINIGVVNINLPDRIITINLDCKATLKVSCTFPTGKFWDPFAYGTMEETHNAIIPLAISISFKQDDEEVDFSIDDIEVDFSYIELNQYTLKDGTRLRTDDPNRHWDDNDYVDNPCPDCGRAITFETEGGNGFCTNCAPNH